MIRLRSNAVATALGLALGTAGGSMLAEMALLPDQEPAPVERPLYADNIDADLESGACWQGGDGHGYPTRMWLLATDFVGSYYVETTVQGRIDRAIRGDSATDIMPDGSTVYTLVAFCDGINLVTGEPIETEEV